jgi:hypothetical protein
MDLVCHWAFTSKSPIATRTISTFTNASRTKASHTAWEMHSKMFGRSDGTVPSDRYKTYHKCVICGDNDGPVQDDCKTEGAFKDCCDTLHPDELAATVV